MGFGQPRNLFYPTATEAMLGKYPGRGFQNSLACLNGACLQRTWGFVFVGGCHFWNLASAFC
jgi:hypothetical protein